MKFRKKKEMLYLDPLDESIVVADEVKAYTLVLSPSLYWIKKLKLPVSSLREVKKLLPSLFEDFLPQGNYSYSVYKKGDEFIAFAYEDKKILTLLEKKKIALADVGTICFAQALFEKIGSPLQVNEKQALSLQDSLVILTPLKWHSEVVPLRLDESKSPQHTIKLQQFGHIADTKSLYLLGGMLLFFMLLLLAQTYMLYKEHERVSQAKSKLFSKYDLQSSTIQNRTIHKKYMKIHKRQTKLRELMALFLSLKLQKGQKIEKIAYKKELFVVNISGVDSRSEAKIKAMLKKAGIAFVSSLKKSRMHIEVKL